MSEGGRSPEVLELMLKTLEESVKTLSEELKDHKIHTKKNVESLGETIELSTDKINQAMERVETSVLTLSTVLQGELGEEGFIKRTNNDIKQIKTKQENLENKFSNARAEKMKLVGFGSGISIVITFFFYVIIPWVLSKYFK